LAAPQVTGTYGTGIGPQHTYVVKKLLDYAKPMMPLHTYATKKFIPLNSGKIAQFTRVMHLDPVTSAGSEGAALTMKEPYAQDFTATVAEWENGISVSTLLDDTFITPALVAYLEILGINLGESMQLELYKTLWGPNLDASTQDAAIGCIPLIFDESQLSTNNMNVLCTTSGSTTTFVSTTLYTGNGALNDSYIGGGFMVIDPKSPLYGKGRRISDSTSSTGILTTTFAATPAIPWGSYDGTTSSDTTEAYCSNFGTAAGSTYPALGLTQGTDILNAVALRKADMILRKCSAPPMSGPYYVALAGPKDYSDLLSDSDSPGGFLDSNRYTNPQPIFENEIGRIGGCIVVLDTRPYHLDETASATTIGDYAAGGKLGFTPVLGKGAFGCVGLQGQLATGQSDTNVIIKRPGPQTTSDPTNKFCTAAWKTTFARLSLDGTRAVGIITYPTEL